MFRSARLPDANPSILLVSNSEADSGYIGEIVKADRYSLVSCSDAERALGLFEINAYDIVLLNETFTADCIVDLISRLRQAAAERFVPVVLLLKDQDSYYLSDYINAGADDFLSWPIQPDILLAKLRLSNQMRLMQATLQHQRDQIRLHNDHLLQEQQVAKRIYDNITSSGCLSAENIRYFMSPMAMFNGDILVAAMRPSGNMLILLGDFTGHGLPAAIGAIPLSSAFYGMVHKGFESEDILREINQKVKAALPVGFFCCACMVELDLYEQTVMVWNGGMPDAYLLHEDSTIETIASSHVALGVLDNRQFDARFQRYAMQTGDRLFLWTDGIIEATNADGSMFGEDKLRKVFDTGIASDDLMRDVCVAVDEFIGDGSSSDDVSIVEISMVNPESVNIQENSSLAQTTQTAPTDWSMSFEISPAAARAGSPIPMMMNLLLEVPGLRQHSSSIFTILTELYSNALEHGILGLDSAAKHSANGFLDYYTERDRRLAEVEGGSIAFHMRHVADAEGGQLTISVHDSGPGFDYEKCHKASNSFSGRGIMLLEQLCESLHYCGNGNQVEAVYRWRDYR